MFYDNAVFISDSLAGNCSSNGTERENTDYEWFVRTSVELNATWWMRLKSSDVTGTGSTTADLL